jgi:hypothetical protein
VFVKRIPDAMLARSHWYAKLPTASCTTCLVHALDNNYCPTKLQDKSTIQTKPEVH